MATRRSGNKSQSSGGSSGSGSRSGSGSGSGTKRSGRASTSRSSKAGRAGTRPKSKPAGDESVDEPTVTATDDVLAASNAQKALNPDMRRVAWLRSQLQNLEAERAERLAKVAQLTVIAIIFTTFVLQNAEPVSVTFLFFSLNIRLIWVIVGCGLLGGVAGYLIGRPEKSIRALIPEREKPRRRSASARRTAGV